MCAQEFDGDGVLGSILETEDCASNLEKNCTKYSYPHSGVLSKYEKRRDRIKLISIYNLMFIGSSTSEVEACVKKIRISTVAIFYL